MREISLRQERKLQKLCRLLKHNQVLQGETMDRATLEVKAPSLSYLEMTEEQIAFAINKPTR